MPRPLLKRPATECGGRSGSRGSRSGCSSGSAAVRAKDWHDVIAAAQAKDAPRAAAAVDAHRERVRRDLIGIIPDGSFPSLPTRGRSSTTRPSPAGR